MRLMDLQQKIKDSDFNPEQAHGYFLKLIEETGELSEALRKGKTGQPDQEHLKGSIAEELYDVLYYVCALANLHDIDLEKTHEMKEALNKIKYG
ncbi:MazG nucleotide pyrophosphohydrolase domain-containing protein [Endozoicomonas numazuensis]|uniref:Nucleotide pyrophosphohydrolase n=1 Tax=Endozoicomonas numazuensis TaxID=1137799 RepID=A0A081NCQ3_9GAMM|nr:MazG nucleotide pyrophosphohydrolase domain-containing protein [Endozoicomonas numazuensis]KEQ16226.1 nucleotide pyrophosphohydrolase [Endozoicomonas numazuensis]